MTNLNFFKAILFTFGLLAISQSQAKTIYVTANANEGHDYAGSQTTSSYDDPIKFSSIFASTASMPSGFFVSGDTLLFKGGQYDLTKQITIVQTSGTSEKRNYIGACAGEEVILDFRKEAYGAIGIKFSTNYCHFANITIRYAGKNGLYVGGSNNLVENCKVYGNGDTGVQLKGGGSNTVKNCDSFQNFDYESTPIGGNADGFCDKQYTSTSGNIFIGCRAWENSDDGWDFFQHISGGNPTQIKESWCFNNGPSQYEMTNHPRYETDKTYLDKYKTSEGKIIITNGGNGNGFKIGGEGTKHNVILTNCVSFNNKVKGFDQNNNGGEMQVYNCTSYANKGNNYGLGNNGKGASLTIMNCVSAPQSVSNSFLTGTIAQTNNWNASLIVTDADFQSVDLNRAYDSRNADGSLTDMGGLFRLNSNSKLIDKGTKIEGLNFCHQTLDLGAFEFCGEIEGGGDDSGVLILDQNFQDWTPVGAGDCSTSTSYSDTHFAGTETNQIALLNGGTVNFTLTDYAVNTVCSAKKPDKQPEEVSNGYLSLNKTNLSAEPPTAGKLVIGALPKITNVFFTLSATGTNRGCYLEYSTDGGNNWIKTQESLYIGSNDTQGGNTFLTDINKENVMLRFSTADQIIRIHDLKIYGKSNTALKNIKENAFDLTVSNNVLYSSEVVSMMIYNVSGVVVKAEKSANQLSLNNLLSGLYIVKAINSEGNVVTKKIKN